MCFDQIVHQYYASCEYAQKGGPYHHHPVVWRMDCEDSKCKGATKIDTPELPLISWMPGPCVKCEDLMSSRQFWKHYGKKEYPMPTEPSLGNIYDAPGAPSRFRSVHSSRAGSPPRLPSIASGSSTPTVRGSVIASGSSTPTVRSSISQRHPGTPQSHTSTPRLRPGSRASSVRTLTSQASEGTFYLDTYRPNEMDEFFQEHPNADSVDGATYYTFHVPGFESPDGNARQSSSASHDGNAQTHQSETHPRSTRHMPSTPLRSLEANVPEPDSRDSRDSPINAYDRYSYFLPTEESGSPLVSKPGSSRASESGSSRVSEPGRYSLRSQGAASNASSKKSREHRVAAKPLEKIEEDFDPNWKPRRSRRGHWLVMHEDFDIKQVIGFNHGMIDLLGLMEWK